MQHSQTIADIGEFGLLSQLLPRLSGDGNTIVGPGQDCAVIRNCGRRSLLTVDALVEGVHFESPWLSARQLGRKSFLVNASDIAAMGGAPRACVVSLGLRPSYQARDLLALQAGIVAAARECGAAVVGGNLSRSDQLFVSIALLGEAPKRIVTRQGAHAGDRIYVTGCLGDAALGVHLLRAGNTAHKGRMHPIRRFREPAPRLLAGRALVSAGVVSAMIDISDGLVQDLGHICRESRVGAVVDTDAVPLSAAYRAVLGLDRSLALRGGEDYELLCTVPECQVKRLERIQGQFDCPITCIGHIERGRDVRVTGSSNMPSGARGYDHFLRQYR